MFSPRVSPDSRFIVAIGALSYHNLLLFDQKTQEWSELLMNSKNPGLGWQQWSGDSKSLYVTDLADWHAPIVAREPVVLATARTVLANVEQDEVR